jgi:hypothetical protein
MTVFHLPQIEGMSTRATLLLSALVWLGAALAVLLPGMPALLVGFGHGQLVVVLWVLSLFDLAHVWPPEGASGWFGLGFVVGVGKLLRFH